MSFQLSHLDRALSGPVSSGNVFKLALEVWHKWRAARAAQGQIDDLRQCLSDKALDEIGLTPKRETSFLMSLGQPYCMSRLPRHLLPLQSGRSDQTSRRDL